VQKKPVQGLTVFLVDGAQKTQEAYGFTYTDHDGAFLLQYKGGGTTSRSKAAQQAQLPELFIEVDDVKGRTMYLSPIAFQPVLGAATYRTIELAGGAQPVGKPPKGVRKTEAAKPRPKP